MGQSRTTKQPGAPAAGFATLHALAVDTDTKLAKLYEDDQRVLENAARNVRRIHQLAGDEEQFEYVGRRRVTTGWSSSLVACIKRGAKESYYRVDFDAAVVRHGTLRAEHARILREQETLDAIFMAHRWSRFFLVTSSDGHIHSSMSCSTCNARTTFGWLPDLSGLTEKDAVAAHGAKLCTVCFPSAPVEWTNFFETQAAAKAATMCPGKYPARGDKLAAIPYAQRRGHCESCGDVVSMTSTGKLRAHKVPPPVCTGSGQAPTSKRHEHAIDGRCAGCGKERMLESDGTVRKHRQEVK